MANKKTGKCLNCKQVAELRARGLCGACYQAILKREKAAKSDQSLPPQNIEDVSRAIHCDDGQDDSLESSVNPVAEPFEAVLPESHAITVFDPETASSESESESSECDRVIVIDLTDFPDIYDDLSHIASEEDRTLCQQARHIIRDFLRMREAGRRAVREARLSAV